MAQPEHRNEGYQYTTNRGWRGDEGFGQAERGNAREAEQGFRFQEEQRGQSSTGVRGAYGNQPGFVGSQGFYTGGDFGGQQGGGGPGNYSISGTGGPAGSYQDGIGGEQPGRGGQHEYGQSFGSGQRIGTQQSHGAGQGYGGGHGDGYGYQPSGAQGQMGGTEQRGRFAGRGPRGYRRSDERIREDVNDRLTDHPDIDAEDINVEVSEAEVLLTGTVDSRWTKRLAEDVAYDVSGVVDVTNNIKVKRGERSKTHEDKA